MSPAELCMCERPSQRNSRDSASYFERTFDLTANVHRFGLLWNRTYIAVYLDGVLFHSFPTPDVMVDKPYFLLVDNGIGGGG